MGWDEFRPRVWESLHTPETQEALAELAEEVPGWRLGTPIQPVVDWDR